MKQQTFTDIEYSRRKRKTRREQFLEMMDQIIPWQDWIEIIRPFYPSGKRGRPAGGIELMLRMYLLQIRYWFSEDLPLNVSPDIKTISSTHIESIALLNRFHLEQMLRIFTDSEQELRHAVLSDWYMIKEFYHDKFDDPLLYRERGLLSYAAPDHERE